MDAEQPINIAVDRSPRKQWNPSPPWDPLLPGISFSGRKTTRPRIRIAGTADTASDGNHLPVMLQKRESLSCFLSQAGRLVNSFAARNRTVKRGLAIGWCAIAALTLAAWILPVEIAQTWAARQAAPDDFAQFEANAAAEATVWCCRWLTSAAALVLSFAWLVAPFLTRALSGFWHACLPSPGPKNTPAWKIVSLRAFVLCWMTLAVYHAGFSVVRRLWDWPVYRLYDGNTVLPNISDRNRDVIRYLAMATPAGSRIYVLSDQKLYFLSYYLLPRRLYHPMHPDSEFVIPQPYNQRPLAAYRLDEISPERIEQLKPDFILEYFESAPYFAERDLEEDSNWIAYQRRRNPAWRPDYLVALRPYVARRQP